MSQTILLQPHGNIRGRKCEESVLYHQQALTKEELKVQLIAI